MTTADPYGLVGQVLDGQFRVDAAIGEGGFSVVYRGRHLGLDEPVAIKCLKLQHNLGSAIVETFVRRFRDESKIHYRLSQGSLHIARTIAAGTAMSPITNGLVPYMVLEWIDGFTLAEQLRARRDRGERGRPVAEVIRTLDPVADAMAFAHSLGVVHRDLNPSNIFCAALPGGGFRLKVMDFGVAKVISDHALALGPRAATMGSIRMFTPAYGAPEQFDYSLGKVTPATDVYALALLVTELLLDRPPISGEHLGDFLERATDPVTRPTPRTLGAVVGDAVEATLAAALSVEPEKRPPDIGAFWGQLKNAALQDEESARRAALRASAPPGAQLTAKGTVILPEQMMEDQTTTAGRASGLGQTQPIPKMSAPPSVMSPSSALMSTMPIPRMPSVPPIDPQTGAPMALAPPPAQQPAQPQQQIPQTMAHLGGPFLESSATRASSQPVFDAPTTTSSGDRARAPVPARRQGSTLPIVIGLGVVALIVLALAGWKLLL